LLPYGPELVVDELVQLLDWRKLRGY
jgi:hypothetical protein